MRTETNTRVSRSVVLGCAATAAILILVGLLKNTSTKSAELHPKIEKIVQEDLTYHNVINAKMKYCKYTYNLCRNNGLSCITSSNCPSGFKHAGTNGPYSAVCGSGYASSSWHYYVLCNQVQSGWGSKCFTNPCNAAATMTATVHPTTSILSILSDVTKVASTVAGMISPMLSRKGSKIADGVAKGALSMVSTALGWEAKKQNKFGTPVDAYNAMVSDLNNLRTNLLSCMDMKLASSVATEITQQISNMETVFTELYSLNGQVPVDSVINQYYAKNTAYCNSAISAIYVDVAFTKSNAYLLLQYATKVMELCMLNYVGLIGAIEGASQNQIPTAGYTVAGTIPKYQCMALKLKSTVSNAITYLEAYWGQKENCGVYTAQTNLLSTRMNYLKNDVLGSITSMANAIVGPSSSSSISNCVVQPAPFILHSPSNNGNCGSVCGSGGTAFYTGTMNTNSYANYYLCSVLQNGASVFGWNLNNGVFTNNCHVATASGGFTRASTFKCVCSYNVPIKTFSTVSTSCATVCENKNMQPVSTPSGTDGLSNYACANDYKNQGTRGGTNSGGTTCTVSWNDAPQKVSAYNCFCI